MPRYIIEFYESTSGQCPVEEAFDKIGRRSKKAGVKCDTYMELLAEYGLALTGQYLEKIEDDMWALRPEYGNVEYRLLFTHLKRRKRFVIVHVIIGKKDQKLKTADIKRASERIKEVQGE